jgi:putative ABC transport system substrate-binding protein
LGRPAGNATGVINVATDLEPKRLEILRELVPRATTIAVLLNPNNAGTDLQSKEMEAAARQIGQQIQIFKAGSESDFDGAFKAIAHSDAGALFVAASPFFTSQRKKLVALAARYHIPASYSFREFAVDGGLMTYGASISDQHRQAGIYTGRILKGEKPADLPVLQPTKFDLVINLKTAKALDLAMPPSVLARADEVIE